MNMEMTAGCGSRNAIVTENLISADAENERMSGQLPPWKIAPPPRLGLGFGLGLGLELGLIFLGGNCPRTCCS